MSQKLREFIKQVRSCKTQAAARDCISKECAIIRTQFKEEQIQYRHRNVAKLLFVHMMGHPTHWGQMEVVKLLASERFADKRIGYLGVMLLLDENSDVLMLVTNSLKSDLTCSNPHAVGLALCALGNISSEDVVRDLADEVLTLLDSTNPFVRKKAALCAVRVIRKVPDLADQYISKVKAALGNKNHGVLLTGIRMCEEICNVMTSSIELFRPLVPSLVRLLKSLAGSGYSAEYSVGSVTDPFLQVRIIRVLRILGTGNVEASEQMADTLAMVATNTETILNVGNAVLYETVRTIMAIESSSGLRVLAINVLGKFLGNRDNNSRYVALKILKQVSHVDLAAVQRHRKAIIAQLQDPDPTIRRTCLDLVICILNKSNIEELSDDLITFVRMADNDYKSEAIRKVDAALSINSPSRAFHVKILLKILCAAGSTFNNEVTINAMNLVAQSQDQLHSVIPEIYTMFTENKHSPSILLLSIWVFGEHPEVLLSSAKVDETTLFATILEGLCGVHATPLSKQFALTSLVKIGGRCPSLLSRVQDTLAPYKQSVLVEAQQRASEYLSLLESAESVKSAVLAKMPAPEITTTAEIAASPSPTSNEEDEVAAKADAAAQDLLNLMDSAAIEPAVASPPATTPTDLLDLLGGEPTPITASPSATSPQASVVVYESNGIDIKMLAKVPNPQQPHVHAVRLLVSNNDLQQINNFSILVAVPKYIQLQLRPCESNVLPPKSTDCLTQDLLLNNSTPDKPCIAKARVQYYHPLKGDVQDQVNIGPL